MYRISVEEFLQLISRGLKKPVIAEDVFSDEIKIQYLKRIDKLFNKGLHYYLDPKAPEKSKGICSKANFIAVIYFCNSNSFL